MDRRCSDAACMVDPSKVSSGRNQSECPDKKIYTSYLLRICIGDGIMLPNVITANAGPFKLGGMMQASHVKRGKRSKRRRREELIEKRTEEKREEG